MVKGLNKLILNEQTVALAIEEYINNRLKIGINIKVNSFFLEDADDNSFMVWFKERKS